MKTEMLFKLSNLNSNLALTTNPRLFYHASSGGHWDGIYAIRSSPKALWTIEAGGSHVLRYLILRRCLSLNLSAQN